VTLTETVLARAEGTSYVVTLARAADPAAPVVVVAPAMGMKARYYLPLIEALAAAGINAAVAEQRGHEADGGRIPGRRYDFGYAELVDDLAGALDSVRAALPGAPIHVLGHSLGGQIAAAYAGSHPGAVDGLIFVAASIPHWPHWGPRLLVAGYAFPLISRVVGHFPGARLRFAGREARGVMRDWGVLARTGRLVVGEQGLADLDIPVLAVSIEGDPLGVPAAVDALAAMLPNATVTRRHLDHDGIDHFRWARETDVIVPLLTGWLGITQPSA
jgi:predicted alpha/beta hydrolase